MGRQKKTDFERNWGYEPAQRQLGKRKQVDEKPRDGRRRSAQLHRAEKGLQWGGGPWNIVGRAKNKNERQKQQGGRIKEELGPA